MSELKQVEGRTKFGPGETWYRITGDLGAGKPPVFILHGGPGAAHNYVDSYKLLSRDGRAVIHYDQLGCGNSTHLPDKDTDFWTPQLFVDELENLVDHLGQRKGFPCAGPVLGRHAGGRIWHAPAQGRQVPDHRQFARLHGTLGQRGDAPALGDAAGHSGRAQQVREGGHLQRPGVPEGDHVGLRAPRLPRRALPAGSDRELRADRPGSDRLSHHERSQRVLRRRHAEELEHHSRTAQDQCADADHLGPP